MEIREQKVELDSNFTGEFRKNGAGKSNCRPPWKWCHLQNFKRSQLSAPRSISRQLWQKLSLDRKHNQVNPNHNPNPISWVDEMLVRNILDEFLHSTIAVAEQNIRDNGSFVQKWIVWYTWRLIWLPATAATLIDVDGWRTSIYHTSCHMYISLKKTKITQRWPR